MRTAFTAALSLLALALASDASAQSSWQDDLALEIEAVEACRVQLLSQVVERTIDGRQVVMAKVHCEDGRVFDATRSEELAPFEFHECVSSKDAQAC